MPATMNGNGVANAADDGTSSRAVQTPTATNKYLRFSLIPEGTTGATGVETVNGHVTNVQQTDLQGVDVQFDGPTQASTTTLSGGLFTLNNLATGDYVVTPTDPNANYNV